MRRCPRCFAVYDDRTTRCDPCEAATESYSDGSPALPAPGETAPPEEARETPTAEGPVPVGDLLLAEADTDWTERAARALAREGIPSRPVPSEGHPGMVALYVAERDHERAIHVVGEALDEPPDVILESPPPEEMAGEGAGDFAGPPNDAPEPDLPSGPPEAPDPDQAAFCPECGEAYRAGFDLCADCAVPLVPMGSGKRS